MYTHNFMVERASATLPREGGNDGWRAACEWGDFQAAIFFFNLHIYSFYLKQKRREPWPD